MDINFKEGYIVCQNSLKNKILTQLSLSNELKNYKFITIKDLKRKLTFNIYNRAIIELSKKYNINPYTSKAYIDSLYKLNGKFSDKLKEIYDFLYDKNLIYEDNLFKNKINDYNYTFIDIDDNLEFEYVKSFINDENINIINTKKEINDNKLTYYSFFSHEEELEFVFSKIHELIKKGVSLNDIKLCNLNDNYSFMVNRIANSYNIFLEENYGTNLLSSTEGIEFINIISNSNNFDEVYEKIKEFKNNDIVNKLIDIINDYELYLYKPIETIDLLKMVLMETKYDSIKYDNQIEIIDLNELYLNKDKYVFILNFNTDIPKILKDDDYLSDKEKEMLNIDQTSIINKINWDKAIYNLNIAKNLTITYPSHLTFDSNKVSPLVKLLDMDEINVKLDDYKFGINKINDDIYLSKALDNLIKYGQENKLLDKYYYTNLKYNDYDYKFSGINDFKIDTIKLSYSTLKEYYECPFRYYLSNILNLNSFENRIEAVLGSYAHGILQDFEEKGKDFDFEVSSDKWFIKANLDFDGNKKIEINPKEEFYFNQMKDNIKLVIDYINMHKENNDLKNALCEKKMEISYDNNKLIFKGFVDKILYDDKNEYVAIIDYKTGNEKASLDNISYGDNLQLPIYIYLLRNNDKFKNAKLVGFYLKKINILNTKYIPMKTDLAQRYENLRLNGFTNLSYVDKIDKTLGTYLANFGLNKDNKPVKGSKIFDKEDEEYLYNLVDELIKKAYEEIKKAHFDITYRLIGGKEFSCKNCNYNDICYKDEKDVKYLDSIPFKREAE